MQGFSCDDTGWLTMALLTTPQLAKEIGVTAPYLNKARVTGTPNIPYIKIGRLVRYDLDAVKDYLAKHSFGGV